MGYGQFSRGSTRRTKAEMLETAAAAGYVVTSSHKAGNNRLEFTTADGCVGFMLHTTVIAFRSTFQGVQKVRLDTGGWPSMTTHVAMGEALSRWGIRTRVHADLGQTVAFGTAFDQTATFDVGTGKRIDTPEGPTVYMVRGFVSDYEGDETPAVTWDAVSGEIRSDGHRQHSSVVSFSPPEVIATLRTILATCRRVAREPSFGAYEETELGGWTLYVTRCGREVHVGCHEFKRADLSTLLRRLERDFPVAAAASVKKTGDLKPGAVREYLRGIRRDATEATNVRLAA